MTAGRATGHPVPEEDSERDAGARVEIAELDLTISARSDLAAFWAGYTDGRAGAPRRTSPPYDEPSIYRRAHAAGIKSFRETI